MAQAGTAQTCWQRVSSCFLKEKEEKRRIALPQGQMDGGGEMRQLDSDGWPEVLPIGSIQMKTVIASDAVHVARPQPQFKGKAVTLGDIRHAQRLKKRCGFEDQYDLGDRLARGGFGTAYMAMERSTGRLVVVKVPDDRSDTDDFHKLKEKSHPHIVRVFDCFQDDSGCHIVMEFCSGGDLFHAFWLLAQRAGSVTTNWCAHVFRQVVDGALYLHETFKQAHNDIKPENILLERPPMDNGDPVRAMLGDFGLVCQYADAKDEDEGELPPAGDPRYAAPELLNMDTPGRPCSATDCWSLGVTLYELLVGKLPFINCKNIKGWSHFAEYDNGKLLKKLFKKYNDMFTGKIQGLPPNCAERVVDRKGRALLQSMLTVNEKKRITLRAVREHKFMGLADDLQGTVHGQVHLPYDVCRAHAARGVFKLREALLEIVESKLTGVPDYDEKLWMEADTNHDGVLSLSEFAALWETVEYPAGEAKPSAEVVFELVDTDDDGTISFDEFMTFQFDPRALDDETRQQCFRSAFNSIAGGNGDVIRPDDLRGAFAEDAAASVDTLFQELDLDGDGMITYGEFERYLMALGDQPDNRSSISLRR